MAFGITRAVFSLVIACTLWKGMVSFEGWRVRGREGREGGRKGGTEVEGGKS